MSWLSATLRGFIIFSYFFIATVWIPDFVLQTSVVAEASSFIQDAAGLVVWGTGLLVGLIGLRMAQLRGLI